MESLIRGVPRSWKELLQHFNGQNYQDVYRALRSRFRGETRLAEDRAPLMMIDGPQ
jgi:hypothetical protein